MRLVTVQAGALALLMLAGCQQPDGRTTGTVAGAGIGGVAGALAGRQLGGGPRSTIIGGLVGAAAGALVGRTIGELLDNPADRRQAQETTRRALEDQPGQSKSWVSTETPNTRGSSEVVRVTEGGTCRTVREVAIIRGEEVQQESRYCRDANGAWARQA